ncbi:MAG: PorP/SprF family type IX secretion system membrane protein [Bacteroidota bacterium]
MLKTKQPMNYRYFILFKMILLSTMMNAQQIPLFENPMAAATLNNPAFISMNYWKYDHNISVSTHYRHQWTGLAAAPKTLLGGYEYFNEELNYLIGGNVVHDQTGPIQFTGIYLRQGYRVQVNSSLHLVAGLSFGLIQNRVKGTELTFLESDDIAVDNEAKFSPDFSLGLLLYSEKFYVGFSIPQSLGFDLNYSQDTNDFRLEKVRHYHGLVGFFTPLYNDSWLEILASAQFVPNAPMVIGWGIKYEYKEHFYIASSYNNAQAITARIGVLFDLNNGNGKGDLSYGLTNSFASFGPSFGGTHELSFVYSFGN